MPAVTQKWTHNITMMQQSVLLTAIRGPDGLPKYGSSKNLLRWLRRCVLLSAMDGAALSAPYDDNGGSFTGPSISLSTLQNEAFQHLCAAEEKRSALGQLSEDGASAFDRAYSFDLPEAAGYIEAHCSGWEPLMDKVVSGYLQELDAIPHHFQLHFLHAAEILGYKHPDRRIASWWLGVYRRLVHDMHLWPETEDQLDRRLGDSRAQWLERADPATIA